MLLSLSALNLPPSPFVVYSLPSIYSESQRVRKAKNVQCLFPCRPPTICLFLISSWCVEDHGSNLRVQPWVILNSWDWRRREEKRWDEERREIWDKKLCSSQQSQAKLDHLPHSPSCSSPPPSRFYTEPSSGWCMCGRGAHFSDHLCIACLSGSVRCQAEQWWYHYSKHCTDL